MSGPQSCTKETSDEQSAFGPPIVRRRALPVENIHGGAISLASILTLSLPICVFEPLSDVQIAAEEVRYAKHYLNQMVSVEDPVERLTLLCSFVVSGYSAMIGRRRKPFNPLLGQTFDYVSEDGWKFHAEKISHHPSITATHTEGPGWELFQALHGSYSFSLTSVSVTPVFPVRLRMSNGDEYSWNKVTTTIQNIRSEASQRKVMNHGKMTIKTNLGLEARLTFVSNDDNTVTGEIYRNGSVVQRLTGSWDKGLHKVLPDKQHTKIFEPTPPSEQAVANYFGFSDFALALNELHDHEREFLPATDSRFRPDQRHLENAKAKLADQTKKQLEQEQRKRAHSEHTIMWFRKEHDEFTGEQLWCSNKLYWSSKEAKFQDPHSRQMLQLFDKEQ